MKIKIGDIVKFQCSAKLRTGKVVEMNVGMGRKRILVELLDKDLRGMGHNGNGICKGTYANNNHWYIDLEDIQSVLDSEEIHITRNGNILNAVMKADGKVVKRAEAKCHPDDEFDLKTGAQLVIDRLFDEALVLHLYSDTFGHYGQIGKVTNMKDVTGKPLFVGDVVRVLGKYAGVNYGKYYVVNNNGRSFIMGIASCCDNDGTICNYYVVKEKSYQDLCDGEKYGNIKAVLSK